MRISGVGCSVVDLIFSNLDSEKLKKSDFLHYAEAIDFESVEKIAGMDAKKAVAILTDDAEPQKRLGGVAIAALIGAAQIVNQFGIDVDFYNYTSTDEYGEFIIDCVKKTPLSIKKMFRKEGKSPLTYVLCDNGKNSELGNRSFISIRSLEDDLALNPEMLDDEFFESDICLFSCVQWEPKIEANFSTILKKIKDNNKFTVVGTASDKFIGSKKWILGDNEKVYNNIDLLIMSEDEAFGYSGIYEREGCHEFFKNTNVGCFVITNGKHDTYISVQNEKVFESFEGYLPIASEIDEDKKDGKLSKGDSIGCGDNFVGGCVAGLSMQMQADKYKKINIIDCCIWGSLSGGITSTVSGGTFYEKESNEKYNLMKKYLASYKKRISKIIKEDTVI